MVKQSNSTAIADITFEDRLWNVTIDLINRLNKNSHKINQLMICIQTSLMT
jgi:hypothetical protein